MKTEKWRLLLLLTILILVVTGLYGLGFNISFVDEAKFLIKGWLMVTGQVGYYSTPAFFYQHMPGGFLWHGLGQKLFGPSLLVGRVQSSLLAGLILGLTYKLAKKLSGKKAGILSLSLLSLSPVIMFYYVSATVYSLATLTLLLGLVCLYDGWVDKQDNKLLWASFWFSLGFIVKENFLFSLGFYMLWLLFFLRKRLKFFLANLGVILVSLGVFIGPGLPDILKVIKNIPYLSTLLPVSQTEKIVLRLYWQDYAHNASLYTKAILEFMIINHALLLMTGLAGIGWWMIKDQFFKSMSGAKRYYWWFLTVLTGYIFLSHILAAYYFSPRSIVSYMAFVTPFLVVIIASVLSEWIGNKKIKKWLIYLYLVLLVLMPYGVRFAGIYSSIKKGSRLSWINQSAKLLTEVVDEKQKILWLSEPMSLYMAGKVSYYPLINHTNFYKPSTETAIVRYLGFWNETMAIEWLDEAELVVLDDKRLAGLSNNPKTAPVVKAIEEIVAEKYNKMDYLQAQTIWPGSLRFYEKKVSKEL